MRSAVWEDASQALNHANFPCLQHRQDTSLLLSLSWMNRFLHRFSDGGLGLPFWNGWVGLWCSHGPAIKSWSSSTQVFSSPNTADLQWPIPWPVRQEPENQVTISSPTKAQPNRRGRRIKFFSREIKWNSSMSCFLLTAFVLLSTPYFRHQASRLRILVI